MKGKKNILCWSRAYLAKLLPTLGGLDSERNYYHVVQTNAEERYVKSLGGQVVLNIERAVKNGLKDKSRKSYWKEPSDFRQVTEFEWSPIYSDRYLPHFSENTRLAIAGIIHHSISDLLKDNKYSFFISEPVALFTTHIFYYFCKKYDVQPRFLVGTYLPGRFYFSSSLHYSKPIKRKFEIKAEEKSELIESLNEFCERVTEDKAGPVYHYAFAEKNDDKKLEIVKQRFGDSALVLSETMGAKFIQILRLSRACLARLLFPYLYDFQTAGAVSEHAFYLRCHFTRRSSYDELPNSGDEGRSFVYPLQYEPEASLLYSAPYAFDQLAFVESVLRSLPDDVTLYVKEHPNQFGALCLQSWRSLKRKYHNIKYIYGRESGRELMKASAAVISISSTAGMDGILLRKPVIVAGNSYYQDFKGVTKVRGNAELAAALNNVSNQEKREEGHLVSIVDHLSVSTFQSYEGDPQPSASLYSQSNLKHILEAINIELA